MKKNTILLATLLLVFSASSEAYEIHPEGFENIPASSGVQYSGELMQWSVWEASDEKNNFELPFSHIAAATKDSGDPGLTDKDFDSLEISKSASGLLKSHYQNRPFDIPETQVQAEAVYTSKIQMGFQKTNAVKSYNLDKLVQDLISSDKPHKYSQVSSKWVHNFLPNFYSAKEQISDSALYFLVSINAGGYNCPVLDFALKRDDGALVDLKNDPYIFTIVKISEVKDLSSIPSLEKGVKKAFVQEIIYGTSFIRSGKNIISFYDEGDTSKIISQNAIVVSDRVMAVPQIFVNALSLSRLETLKAGVNALTSSVPGSTSEENFVVTNENTEITTPHSNECGVGLGLGIASYTFNLAASIVKGISK